MGALTRIIPPGAEPVLLPEGKDHLRVDITDDDALITALLLASKDKVEELTSRRLITQTWRWTFDQFPAWDFVLLPLAPVISVLSIKTFDLADVPTTFALSNVIVDIQSEPSRIVLRDGIIWPPSGENLLREANGVEIDFTVGYGVAGSSVPENLKLALKLITGHYYENREPTSPIVIHKVPMAVKALLTGFSAWNEFHHARVDPPAQNRRRTT